MICSGYKFFVSFPTTAVPFTTNEPQSYVLGGRNHPLHSNSCRFRRFNIVFVNILIGIISFGHGFLYDEIGQRIKIHILRDIRSEHRPDTMTADEVSFAENMQNQLREAMNFEGSSEEKKAKALLATLGIDYDAITMEQFVNLIEVLKLSKHLKTPISQRGKTAMTHGKGKRKKR